MSTELSWNKKCIRFLHFRFDIVTVKYHKLPSLTIYFILILSFHLQLHNKVVFARQGSEIYTYILSLVNFFLTLNTK